MRLEDKIKEQIKKQGYTLKSFADKIDIPYTTLLTMLQKDIGKSSVDNVLKVAKGLNTTVEELMEDTIETIWDANDPNIEEKILSTPDFKSAEEAISFILAQPAMASYGGYTIEDMTDDEILDMANNMLLAMKLSLERKK